MATIRHQVWIDAPVARVFDGIATAEALSRWWAPHTSTSTDAGTVLAHGAGSEHGEVKLLVAESVSGKSVEWEVISRGHPAKSPASAWTGTRIRFDLSERENPGAWRGIESSSSHLAVLEFRHSGWDEESEYFGFCSYAWAEVLGLLKQWCEASA